MFHIYGLLIGVGVVVALVLAVKLMKNGDDAKNMVLEAVWWMLLPGIVGARLYHVIDQWQYYRENLILIVQPWLGGLGIFGGVAGGVAGLFAFSLFHARREEKKIEEIFYAIADVVSMGASIAQAIGRWGNYFNRELYGKETSLPWGMWVDGKSGRYHPLFIYESVLDLILFVILLSVYKGSGKRGSTFGSYLIGYGIIRGVLEYLRVESWAIGGIPVAQAMSVVFIVSGVFVLSRKHVFIRDEDLKVKKDEDVVV